MNKRKYFFLCLGIYILFFVFLVISLYFNVDSLKYELFNNNTNLFQLFLGFLLLIVGIYFFVLPEKFIVGGLESELIFLDKLFFYDKKTKRQKEFFSNSNFIMILRFFIIFIFGSSLSWGFFWITMIVNFFFMMFFQLMYYFRISPKFLLEFFPFFANQKPFYKLFLSSIIIGLFIGIGCGLIFKNNGSTGGSDVILKCLSHYFHNKVDFTHSMMFIDGTMILFSCFLDLKRHSSKKKKEILIRYFFSLFAFFNAIFFIKLILN
ncbi:MAG: YitT family protein [Vigna little leaf phytoplasma]|nr:YitT family protein [Vigna little leaf phytoplasma]